MSNTTTITLSDDLRINDYDANQYTIERRSVVQKGARAGVVVWTPIAYCGSIRSLPVIARRIYASEHAAAAREKAEIVFDNSSFPKQIAALPPKGAKNKGEK